MTAAPTEHRRRVGSLEVLLFSLIALAVSAGAMSAFVAGDPRSEHWRQRCSAACSSRPCRSWCSGVVVSGLIAAFVSAERLARWLPRSPALAVAVAGVGGAALPGCECGSVPVARRLFGPGTSGAAALTFMLSAPAINPVVLVATAVAFPGQPAMVLARCVASLATAVVMGLLWSRFGRDEWVTRDLPEPPATGSSRWTVFTEAARHDFLQAASYLVVGAAAAAALRVLVPAWVFQHLAGNLVVGVLTMALLAVVLALCSEADAFVAASMTMLPLVPRLVFLVVGPCVRREAVGDAGGHVRPPLRGAVRSRHVRGGHGRRDDRRAGVLGGGGEPGHPEHRAPAGRAEHRGDARQGHLPELRETGAAAVADRGRPGARRPRLVAAIVRDLRHAACTTEDGASAPALAGLAAAHSHRDGGLRGATAARRARRHAAAVASRSRSAGPFPPLPPGPAPTVSLPETVMRAAADSTNSLERQVDHAAPVHTSHSRGVDIGRVVIVCCAADAQLARIHLTGPGATAAAGYPDDTWLQIQGQIVPGSSHARTASSRRWPSRA